MIWSPPTLHHDRPLRDEASEQVWRFAMIHIAKTHDLWPCELEPYSRGEAIVWSAGDHVFKLTTPACVQQLDAEASCLPQVLGRLSVATPRYVTRGEINGWPYVVIGKIPGTPLADVWPKLGHQARLRMARKLGSFCRELHALPSAGFPAGWPEFWAATTKHVGVRHATRGGPPGLLASIDSYLARIGELGAAKLVTLHTELTDEHVYVERRDEEYELVGLLDFADARLGAAHYEFGALVEFVFRGEPGLLREFLIAYGIDPARLTPEFAEVLLAWALCHRFAHLGRMLDLVAPEEPDTLEELAAMLFSVSKT